MVRTARENQQNRATQLDNQTGGRGLDILGGHRWGWARARNMEGG